MSAENPQSNPQEVFQGVTHDQAVQEFGRTITQAALGNQAGGYEPNAPVQSEKHTGKVDETVVGNYEGSLLTARASNSTRYNEKWRDLELSSKRGEHANGTHRFTEIAVDLASGKAQERRMQYGADGRVEKKKGIPSTRRLMAATRLVNHKYGLKDKDNESKAA